MGIELEKFEAIDFEVTEALECLSPLNRKVYLKKKKEWMQSVSLRFARNPSSTVWADLELSMAYYQQSFFAESRLRIEEASIGVWKRS